MFFSYPLNSIVQFGFVGMQVLWRIDELAFTYHGENKSLGDLFCQIRIKEDGYITHEYLELD